MQRPSPSELTVLSDGELLAMFYESNEEEQAFRAIVTRHKTMVSSVCTSVLKNHADAEDAFQATFFILARKAKHLQGKECIGGWLHRVALRCALTALRRRTRRQEVPPFAEYESQQSALERVSTTAMQGALHEALDKLPEKYRLPLILCYIEGMSCQEAAQRMKLTETAIYKRLERGRQRLRSRLTALGVGACSLLLASSCTAAALAGQVTATKVNSTVFVAMQAKLAWAKGALASAGNQASLTLAQGVMKTMMMSMLLKSACAALVGLSVGFVSMSTVALAEQAQAKQEGQQIAIALADADRNDHVRKSEQLEAEVTTGQDAKTVRVTTRNVVVNAFRVVHELTPARLVTQPKTLTVTTVTSNPKAAQIASEPKVVDASKLASELATLQVVAKRKVVNALRVAHEQTPARVVVQPQILTVTTVTSNPKAAQIASQSKVSATSTTPPNVVHAARNPALEIYARLESLDAELKRLNAQIDLLIQLQQDK